MSANSHRVRTIEQLEAIYGQPSGPAVIKVIDRINDSYRKLIEVSPFVAIATCGPEGLDWSPKGDPAARRSRTGPRRPGRPGPGPGSGRPPPR
ncbi:MAG: hypothetical protein P8Y53_25615 [Pseudolabrys sp.]